MFRGFRWQLLALVIALLVFAASAIYRFAPQPSPAPPQTTASPSPSPVPTAAAVPPPAAEAPPPASDIFREGLVGSIQRLNPLFAHLNQAERAITSLIFEGLYATNEYGEPLPQLAAEAVISNDGLEIALRLREDVLWQDGIAFSADDVVYTMSLLAEAAYADYSPAAAFWRSLETQKLGEFLLRFRLAQPLASFPHLLTIGMLPAHALRGTSLDTLLTHPFTLSPIGTGPYQLAALRAAPDGSIGEVALELAPAFQQRPEAAGAFAINGLNFTFYPDADAALSAWGAGAIDGLAGSAPLETLERLPGSQLYSQLESALGVLIFNWADERFDDRRLRAALALGLDLPSMISARFGSSATFADSPYVAGFSVYKPNEFWTRYDPEQARALLESAALEADAATSEVDGESRAEFSLLVQDRAPLWQVAADMAERWGDIGLSVAVEAVSGAELTERLEAGAFDMAIHRQRIGGDPDLFRFWHPAQYESGFNYGGLNDISLATALEQARSEPNAFRRSELLQEVQTLFADGVLALPLWYPVYFYAVRDTFAGIELGYLVDGSDRFRNIGEWRLAAALG